MSTILYKPGQGYWTRLMSAVGAGVVVVFGAMWAWEQAVNITQDQAEVVYYQGGIAGAIILLGLAVTYFLCYVHKGVGEFMIATEGEMRKVNWSSRKEIMGSTWVVIAISVIIAAILFVVDIGFGTFFRAIDVLKTG